MNREAEIARLRHELDILRTRLSLYERWGRIVRIFFMIWTPLFAAAIVFALVKVFQYDAFMGGFLVILLAMLTLAAWLMRSRDRPASSGNRSFWTDLVAPARYPVSLTPEVPAFSWAWSRRSDAAIIENQIAEREQRLTELGLAP